MPVRIIDLSVPIRNDPNKIIQAQVSYQTHEEGARNFCPVFGLDPQDLPEGKFGAAETVTAVTHAGTHMDAPYHYWPTSEGKPARTIDQIPLEWCYGDGVVLDLTHKQRGELITIEDVQGALRKIGYKIKAWDIILIRTDTTTKHFFEPGYENMHAGMSREATLWLVEQGIKVMGIDAWGFDRPFVDMVAEFKAGVKDRLWAAHWVGREKEYLHIENLTNLDQIPRPYGFKVAAFPIKIERGSGGWVRAVAIIEE
ncbi:MAG: cyclase family protein [Dehalococcoidia bacterium]|nr:cyclase family protein [Dehalococcoidia bacterium]